MYAVIRSGGKQYKVETGQRLEVERVGADTGANVELEAILLVDGDTVLATPAQLGKAKVKAKVVDEAKGPKIRGFTYKNKSNQRRRWGHRQHYSVLEITAITAGAPAKATTKTASKAPTKAPTKTPTKAKD
jgi:large subunit ribosomal protein L21